MKARVLTAAALLALLLPLAACGDDDDADPGSSSAETTPSASADEEAVKTAWTTVFDSAVPVPDKLRYVADPTAAEPVLTAYAGAGQQVGGITFAADSVVVNGDGAEITYDVAFAGNPVYQDLKGAVERSGDTWVVSQRQFCEVMASARTPCP